MVDNLNGETPLLNNCSKTKKQMQKTERWKTLIGQSGGGDRDLWMKYYHKDEIGNEGIFGKLGNDVKFSVDKFGYDF